MGVMTRKGKLEGRLVGWCVIYSWAQFGGGYVEKGEVSLSLAEAKEPFSVMFFFAAALDLACQYRANMRTPKKIVFATNIPPFV